MKDLENKHSKEGYAIAEVVDIISRAAHAQYGFYDEDGTKKVAIYAYDELKSYFEANNKPQLKDGQTILLTKDYDKIIKELKASNEAWQACEDQLGKAQDECKEVNKNNFKIINDKASIESQLEQALEGNSNLKEAIDKKEGQVDKLLNILNRVDF